MRNLVFLVAFLVLIGFLIFWLWSDKDENQTLEQAIATQQATEEVSETDPTSVQRVNLDEVEVAYDDNGLVIKTLYNQPVDLTLSTNPVRNVEVYDGVMTYQEQLDGNWNFRSYNLGQYIEANLKEE